MEFLPRAGRRSSLTGLRLQRQRSVVCDGTERPRASAYSTAGGRRSSIRQVQGHHFLRLDRPARLSTWLGAPFFEPAGEGISAYPKDAADRAFGPALPVGLKDALLFFFGILVRVRIEHQVGSAIFAIVLLRSAGAVAIFDDVGASAFATLVGRLNHARI